MFASECLSEHQGRGVSCFFTSLGSLRLLVLTPAYFPALLCLLGGPPYFLFSLCFLLPTPSCPPILVGERLMLAWASAEAPGPPAA